MAKSEIAVRMTGEEADLWRSLGKVITQQKKVRKEYKGIAEDSKAASRKEVLARRKAEDALNRQRQAALEARKGFGSAAVQELNTFTLKLGAVKLAVNAVAGAFRSVTEAERGAAQIAIQAEPGLMGLVQLSSSEKELRTLVAASKKTFQEGGASTLEEAGQLTFQLKSAGAMKERKMYSDLRGIVDTTAMARAAGTLQAAMGLEETGTHRQIISKVIAGAADVTGVSASEVAMAATRGAASAKMLGMSDEELIAATVAVAKTTGDAPQAGTQVASLLKSLAKEGFVEDYQGKSFKEMLGVIQAKKMTQPELIKYLGREEAARAYTFLQGEGYDQALGKITAAQEQDLVGQKIRMRGAVADLDLPRQARVAKNKEMASREKLGQRSIAADTQWDTAKAMRREEWARRYGGRGMGDFEQGIGEILMGTEGAYWETSRRLSGDADLLNATMLGFTPADRAKYLNPELEIVSDKKIAGVISEHAADPGKMNKLLSELVELTRANLKAQEANMALMRANPEQAEKVFSGVVQGLPPNLRGDLRNRFRQTLKAPDDDR